MTPPTVEEQQHDGPEVNLALGILRKDFDKIERAILAGARTVHVRGHLLEAERATETPDNLHGLNDPMLFATKSGFTAGEAARLQQMLKTRVSEGV